MRAFGLDRVAAAGVVLALSTSGGAGARPFGVDDLLSQESFGAAAFDPTGRRLIFEQRGRYDRAPRFDAYTETSQLLSRLWVVDLKGSVRAQPLLRPDPGLGVLMGPFSPDGRRLAVYRLQARTWRLGVVTLASGATRWFAIAPQDPAHGRTLQWISGRELLVLDRPDGLPPVQGRLGWAQAARLPRLWAAAARGAGASTALGSGAYASVRRRAPPTRLLRLDTVHGTRRILARGEYFDLEAAPDGQRVALFEAGPDLQPRGNAPVRGAAGLETEATRLDVLDLGSGRRTLVCPTCDLSPQLLAWSASGRSLLAYARGPDGLWPDGALLRVTASTGEAQVIGQGLRAQLDVNPVRVRAAWVGEHPLMFAKPTGQGARADWYDLDGSARNLTAGLVAPGKLMRSADPTGFTVFTRDGLWRVGLDGAVGRLADSRASAALPDARPVDGARSSNIPPAASLVSLRDGDHATIAQATPRTLTPLFDATPGGPLAAATTTGAAGLRRERDPSGLERLVLLRAGRPAVTVATINRALSETAALVAEPIHHLGAQGEPLTSWLFRPAGAAPGGGPPPLLVEPYLGGAYPTAPRDLPGEAGLLQNLRVLSGHGYAVLVPSLPNPPQGMTEPADHLADRILAVVHAAAQDPRLTGAFDPERLALIGWSFGGYTVMATITQTDRFRAAVEMDGISDLTAYWAHLAPFHAISPEDGYGGILTTGGVEATQPALGAPPWIDPDRYHRNSPLLTADRIHTPLLLLHGALDNIPIAGSEAMYSALFRQGKDALFVTYWGAGHTVTSPGDVRDVYARTFKFLDAHLGPPAHAGDPPAASPAPVPASGGPRPPPPRR